MWYDFIKEKLLKYNQNDQIKEALVFRKKEPFLLRYKQRAIGLFLNKQTRRVK